MSSHNFFRDAEFAEVPQVGGLIGNDPRQNLNAVKIGYGAPTGVPDAQFYIDMSAATAQTIVYVRSGSAWVASSMAFFSASVPIGDGLGVNRFAFTNLTGAPLTIRGVSLVYAVISTGAATLDVRKVLAGVNAPSGGTSVTLLTATMNLQTTANTLIQPTLTATLADRILAPLDKVSFVVSASTAGLSGGVVTLLF